jgi:hypothetical protein
VAGLVTAATVDLNAVSGIGSSTALSLAATTITADNSNGNLDINNTLGTAVTATTLTTGTGSIQFDQSGRRRAQRHHRHHHAMAP